MIRRGNYNGGKKVERLRCAARHLKKKHNHRPSLGSSARRMGGSSEGEGERRKFPRERGEVRNAAPEGDPLGKRVRNKQDRRYRGAKRCKQGPTVRNWEFLGGKVSGRTQKGTGKKKRPKRTFQAQELDQRLKGRAK